MDRNRAELVGQQAAKEDIEQGFIDGEGNILDEEALKEHIRAQIRCKIDTTDLSIGALRDILERADGVRNDFVGVRYSPVLGDRLIRLSPELDPYQGQPPAPDPPRATDLLQYAMEAYEQYVLLHKARIGK